MSVDNQNSEFLVENDPMKREEARKKESFRKLYKKRKSLIKKGGFKLESTTFYRGLILLIYLLAFIRLFTLYMTNRSFSFTTYVYIKLFGIIHLEALISLWVQIHGLIGSRGIVPLFQTMQIFKSYFSENTETSNWQLFKLYFKIPSLFWFCEWNDSNLNRCFFLGTFCSICLIIGIFPAPILLCVLYLIYLTMIQVCESFLSLQWDVLLLESTFLSIILSFSSHSFNLFHIFPSSVEEPSKIILFLLWWLLFRLMFSSGVVKLTSGDPTWFHLEAMNFHYETQPIPGTLSHWIHNQSFIIHKLEVIITFMIELICPFLIFGPRLLQGIACFFFIFLNFAISITGNYGFFNIHVIVMCTLLLDNNFFCNELFRSFLIWPTLKIPKITITISNMYIYNPLFLFIMSLSLIVLNRAFRSEIIPIPRFLSSIYRYFSSFYILNAYGLFAVMTTKRLEICIEGSEDGVNWIPFEFKYKPGNIHRRPPFIIGHMPRLDWRMWFLPLSSFPSIPSWFVQFLEKLQSGSKPVLKLLESFPSSPKFLRVLQYEYKFTTREELKITKQYWNRIPRGNFIPLTLCKGN